MPELLFEIWGTDPNGGGSMYLVHPQNDKIRALSQPNALLLHSFTAGSTFEAFRQKNAWFGHAPWQPPEDLRDHQFTDQEIEEQQAYLACRSGNS